VAYVSRFVQPTTKLLPISQGDTLTVRERLNYGEQSAAHERMYAAGVDGELKVNPRAVDKALVVAYLLDWTLKDADGELVPIRGVSTEELAAALDALEPEAFGEIRNAIEEHIGNVVRARAAQKKTNDGEVASTATLPSAV
jgi:hypothetical protein